MLYAGAAAFLLSTSGALPLAARPRHEVASTVRAEPRPQEKSKPVVVERKAEDKELAPITAQQLARVRRLLLVGRKARHVAAGERRSQDGLREGGRRVEQLG